MLPPVIVAFFIAVGFATGSAIVEVPAWAGRDSLKDTKLGDPATSFLTRLSAPAYQVAERDVRGRELCQAVVFGHTPSGRVTRAQFDGKEQEVAASWGVDVTAEPNTRRTVVARYLDPVGGAELACQTVTFLCVNQGWTGLPIKTVSNGAPCREDAGPQAGIDQSGKPRLVLRPPNVVLATRYVATSSGGFLVGTVVLIAELRGQLDEDWWCPRVEWEFPQSQGINPDVTTRSSHESDCAPYTYEAAQKQQRRLTTRVSLPEGRWQVTVRLYKAERVIAKQSVMVQVGPDQSSPVDYRVQEPAPLRPGEP